MPNFEVTRPDGEKVRVVADRAELAPNGAMLFLDNVRVGGNGGAPGLPFRLVRVFAEAGWLEVADQTAALHLPGVGPKRG